MPDLPPQAVGILYPVLMILATVVLVLGTLIGGLWAGFRWLHGQIEETSTKIVKPVAERLAVVEKKAEAAHRRIDLIEGKDLHEHG